MTSEYIFITYELYMDCLDDLEKLMELKNDKDGFTVQKT